MPFLKGDPCKSRFCPFCQAKLWETGLYRSTENFDKDWTTDYCCRNDKCFINNFPRYRCSFDPSIGLLKEEYALDSFYVKVDRLTHQTSIFRLNYAVIEDQVTVARLIWLNSTNSQETLDKLKICVIFS